MRMSAVLCPISVVSCTAGIANGHPDLHENAFVWKVLMQQHSMTTHDFTFMRRPRGCPMPPAAPRMATFLSGVEELL